VIKDVKQMFELFDFVVEEIGEDNVVHVVSDDASNFVAVGKMLKFRGGDNKIILVS